MFFLLLRAAKKSCEKSGVTTVSPANKAIAANKPSGSEQSGVNQEGHSNVSLETCPLNAAHHNSDSYKRKRVSHKHSWSPADGF